MDASKFVSFAKQSGPGWLQAAVTLGGGSLIGALYLGVIGGFEFMWLQPLAMLCGVIMLSAISYVTLSTEERPFLTVKRSISPSLAWAWLLATVIADTVFCAAQFALGEGAVRQNLGVEWPPFIITGTFFVVSLSLIWLSTGKGKAAGIIENVLKALVAVVVLAFMGVVVTLAAKGAIPWSELFAGFIPDPSALFRPTDSFAVILDQMGGTEQAYWQTYLLDQQRDVIITAFGTAVGINMTFLLPYTLLKRGWGKKDRELSRFDLGFGLFLPFILATSFLVIASASQFHARTGDVFLDDGSIATSAQASYVKIIDARLKTLEIPTDGAETSITLAEEKLSESERDLAAMLVKRDAKALASSLEPFLGKAAQPIFGIGVLAMALSTMLVHMMMNGYAIGEAFGKHGNRTVFFIGASLPAIAGFFSPVLWAGSSKAALAVPASVIATSLLPIAYLAFLLLMNSRSALGDELPKRRGLVNLLLIFATGMASFGSIWVLLNKGTPGLIGLGALGLLAAFGIFGFIRRSNAA